MGTSTMRPPDNPFEQRDYKGDRKKKSCTCLDRVPLTRSRAYASKTLYNSRNFCSILHPVIFIHLLLRRLD